MTTAGLAERLGGKKVLETEIRSDWDLVRAIDRGLPARAVDEVLAAGLLEPAELYDLVIPRRTLARRKEADQPLTPEESDRLTRVVRVLTRAEEAVGDVENARTWLRTENRALRGTRPLDLLESDAGARMVEAVLGRIEHGVYS